MNDTFINFAPFEETDTVPERIRSAVYQAVGAASVAWENPGGAGVFDTEKAKRVAESLIHFLREQGVEIAS